ncbi:MAG: response regulator transcription factor [Deltaproteobacteria bacterium]|nr:response regulator transcription factor [Candidatus Anaeroferrophillus wilburensis]MBN2887858.1 response regulator transcription factor [Deltaproteobacteria bacterium]
MTKQSIMLIDDDPDIVAVLQGNLILAGFSVTAAGSAQETLVEMDRQTPDLVILDLNLPDLDGLQLCRKIKAAGYDMPIIMLTARDSVADKVVGFECGADDYLVKPFAFLELEARIKACLRREASRAQDNHRECVRCGKLTIDRSSRQAWLAGQLIALTRKEFDLLCFLTSHAGQVVSRDDLRHALWGQKKLYSWSRTIDVHIQHLRQKLEQNPENPELIVTVTGVGYRLDDPAA